MSAGLQIPRFELTRAYGCGFIGAGFQTLGSRFEFSAWLPAVLLGKTVFGQVLSSFWDSLFDPLACSFYKAISKLLLHDPEEGRPL